MDPTEAKVILLQSGNRILPDLKEGLCEFRARLLERRGVEIRANTMIKGATAQSAILADGITIPTRTLVAAVGSAPNRLLDTVPCPRDPRGRLVVDETLVVLNYPGIWAVGDCAAIPDGRSGGTCPPTAQYALREARHVARNIVSVVNGANLRSFSHKSLGVFVPLGRFSAAADVMGLKLSGFLAWWLYRTYYLYQLPRLERKLKVVLDWTLELFFHRDNVQMNLIKNEGILRVHYETGDIIFRQGELAQSFFIILAGEVQVSRHQNEQEKMVATLGAGEYFGEMSLLLGVQHSASARALTPVDILVMNGADFVALTTSSTHFSELLAGATRQRLSNSDVNELSGVRG